MKKGCEGIAVTLFIAMFATFLLQIFSRYVLNAPLGWTVEVCVILYIWLVFWTAAFLLRDSEHVSFNMLFLMANPRQKRVMAILGIFCIGAAMAAGLPVIIDYVQFMRIEKAPVTRIPLDYIYAIFPVFVIAVVIRSAVSLYRLFTPRWRAEVDAIAGEQQEEQAQRDLP
jgi:TRAP-type C4-dicarboxylate transport system permease small subunit|tara:strand:- start:1455 stop:1964 length:510 start_codon:yes stop_codon:yes gene_type:complete